MPFQKILSSLEALPVPTLSSSQVEIRVNSLQVLALAKYFLAILRNVSLSRDGMRGRGGPFSYLTRLVWAQTDGILDDSFGKVQRVLNLIDCGGGILLNVTRVQIFKEELVVVARRVVSHQLRHYTDGTLLSLKHV